MADITAKSKWLFWSMIIAVVLFATVPSLVFLEKSRSYWHFLTGWNPGTLKQLKVRRMPSPRRMDPKEPEIRFVEFRMDAPAAEKVRLLGSFNGWGESSIPLRKSEDGEWEIVVPLPAGRYPYVFEVDGTWTQDPRSDGKADWGGKKVSVREVE